MCHISKPEVVDPYILRNLTCPKKKKNIYMSCTLFSSWKMLEKDNARTYLYVILSGN